MVVQLVCYTWVALAATSPSDSHKLADTYYTHRTPCDPTTTSKTGGVQDANINNPLQKVQTLR